jgi:hypothetical protein
LLEQKKSERLEEIQIKEREEREKEIVNSPKSLRQREKNTKTEIVQPICLKRRFEERDKRRRSYPSIRVQNCKRKS